MIKRLKRLEIMIAHEYAAAQISQHIDGIFKNGELDTEATHKKFLFVQAGDKV